MKPVYRATFALCYLALTGAFAQAAAPPAARVPDADTYTATYRQIWQHVGDRYQCGDIHGWAAFEHKYDGKLTTHDALRVAVDDMLSAARDARVRLLTSPEAQRYQARRAGGYAGVGLSFETRHFVTDSVTIKKVLVDSTAEDANLWEGDVVEAVNGTSLAGVPFDAVADLLKGKPGTLVTLSIAERAGRQKREVSVKRDLDGTLGVEITLENPTKLFRITYVMHASPAEKSGIKEGDLIVSIDGYIANHLSEDDAREHLRGKMGTVAALKIRRDGKERDVSVVRGVVPNWGLFIGLRSSWSGRNRALTQVELKSLDWDDVFTMIDHYMDDMNKGDASIVDLRGCEGTPEAAARVAARFIASGELLRFTARDGSVTTEVVFSVNNDRVLKRTVTVRNGNQSQVTTQDVETVPAVFKQKLVVLIDGKTRGVAAAVASVLKRSGNGTLVGSPTSPDYVVNRTESFGEGDAALYVQMPALLITDDAGKSLSRVYPDRRVWFGDAMKEAKDELCGMYWYTDPMFIGIGVAGSLFAIIAVCLVVSARRAARQEAAEKALSQEHDSASGCCGEATGGGAQNVGGSPEESNEPVGKPAGSAEPLPDAGSANPQSDNLKPTPAPVEQSNASDADKDEPTGGSKWPLWAVLGVMALVVSGLVYLNHRMHQPPSGAKAEVIVEFYTDGSADCDDQAAVIERLKREYDGPVRFETIDVRKQPFLTPEVVGETTEKVSHVPMIRVRYHWLDKDGKHISSGSQSGGARTKRDLVRDIETAETNLNYQYPCSEKIVRHRGRL